MIVELTMTVVLSAVSCEQVWLQVPANKYSNKDIQMIISHKCYLIAMQHASFTFSPHSE